MLQLRQDMQLMIDEKDESIKQLRDLVTQLEEQLISKKASENLSDTIADNLDHSISEFQIGSLIDKEIKHEEYLPSVESPVEETVLQKEIIQKDIIPNSFSPLRSQSVFGSVRERVI